MSDQQRVLASALSGLLSAISYPGYGFEALIWVALIPLLVALNGQTPKKAFKLGWAAGYVFFLGILPWLLSLWDWASVFIAVGYLVLCACLGTLWGIWAALTSRMNKGKALLYVTYGSGLWVLVEFVKEQTPFGFGWGTLGYTLHAFEPLAQWAAVTGVWGLSWMVVAANIGLYWAWAKRDARWFGGVVLCLVLLGVFGNGMLEQTKTRIDNAPTLNLALIQPNIEQRDKSNPTLLEPLKDKYLELINQLEAQPDIVILPESILPTLMLDDDATFNAFLNAANEMHADLLLGSFTRRANDLFNSVIYAPFQQQVYETYNKVHLVPFSTEYFPMIDVLENMLGDWLTRLPLGALTAGEGFIPIQSTKAVIGTPICFETTFVDISRAFVLNGAEVLVSVTNDAWFKDSVELDQHFVKGKLRAIETGRGFVQVANTGLSGIVLPTGETSLMLDKLKPQAKQGIVPLLNHQTPFVKWGHWWVAFTGILALCALIWSKKVTRTQTQSSHPSE